ncbi:hypothetical protein K1719_039875 [Acacia pycnantha]|nr:hypothetical protein K1719_039875 [Acacia pycnantha]
MMKWALGVVLLGLLEVSFTLIPQKSSFSGRKSPIPENAKSENLQKILKLLLVTKADFRGILRPAMDMKNLTKLNDNVQTCLPSCRIETLYQFLDLLTLKTEVHAVCKEPYSIYKAVLKSNGSINKINQIAQLRIIIKPKACVGVGPLCSSQQICYHVLGLVHGIWTPIPRSMKDYIATPKPNGYQSLHTTVIPFLYQRMFGLEVQVWWDLSGLRYHSKGFKHDVADNGSATWFLQDLATKQNAEGSVVKSYPRQAFINKIECLPQWQQLQLQQFCASHGVHISTLNGQ